ncbi:hypothetical protein HII12_002997 [Brettanomyces bruxellensis]|uniref:Mediator of RNA polymerase II transcription subunit 12 n=1 Tax=Dekkera bruxellensis TaxID=5007 RepID=A0A8H6BEH6_DEKBR|nr:hypothetical protein HII12_002997 [Brettanomyces bruxellensis]
MSQDVASKSVSSGEMPYPKDVYPLNITARDYDNTFQAIKVQRETAPKVKAEFPDFHIWKHTSMDDKRMCKHLQKGYYQPPVVSNECHSGRQIVSQLLHSANGSDGLKNGTGTSKDKGNVTKRKLNLMGDVMMKALIERHKMNRIRGKSTYRPPPRVTLTEHKREMWMRKLADGSIPLKKLSKAVPHGLRNKMLLLQCLKHNIPISRAIWLIKCISSNEQRQLKRRASNSGSVSLLVGQWTVEWTEQVCMFLEHIYKSCSDGQNKEKWKLSMDYGTKLVNELYFQNLLNREVFLSWVVQFLGKLVKVKDDFTSNLWLVSIHYHAIRLYLFRILKIDYLSKELVENMLLVVAKIYETGYEDENEYISHLSDRFKYLVRFLFYYNSGNFIIPSNWSYLKPYLRKVLTQDMGVVKEQFNLITYRNESLMMDEFDNGSPNSSLGISEIRCYNATSRLIYKLDNYCPCHFDDTATTKTDTFTPEKPVAADSSLHDINSLRNLSKFIFSESSLGWKQALDTALYWTITKDCDSSLSFQRICLVCSILQTKLFAVSTLKRWKFEHIRKDVIRELTGFVYKTADVFGQQADLASTADKKPQSQVMAYSMTSFLVLISRFFQLGLFSMTTYLRKLIASGIIYLSSSLHSCRAHLMILYSLSFLSDDNSNNLIMRLSERTNIIIPREMEAKSKNYAENWLKSFLEKVSKQGSCSGSFDPKSVVSYESYYSLVEYCGWQNDHEQFMSIGSKLQLGSHLLLELQNVFNDSSENINLNVTSFTILYNLFKCHFYRYPRFVYMLFKMLDKERVIIHDDETMAVLLKTTIYNQGLLDSYLLNESTTVWSYVLSCLNKWMNENRKSFNLARSLQLSRIKLEGLEIKPLDEVFSCNVSQEELNELGISSMERLSKSAEFSHSFTQIITSYFNVMKGFNSHFKIPVLELLQSLRIWKQEDFDNLLVMYIKKTIQPTITLDHDTDLKLILKLVIDNLLTISQAIKLFSSPSNGASNEDFHSMLYDILFIQSDHLKEHEYLLLKIERARYREAFPDRYYQIMFQFIDYKSSASMEKGRTPNQGVDIGEVDGVVVPADVITSMHDLTSVSVNPQLENSGTHDEFSASGILTGNSDIVNSVWSLCTTHFSTFIELLYSESGFSNSEAVWKLFYENILALKYSDEGTKASEFNLQQIMRRVNYYNLHICQWLFKCMVEGRLNHAKGNNSLNNEVMGILKQTLTAFVNLDKVPDDYLIGELFEYLNSNVKFMILSSAEDLYLGGRSFPQLLVGNGKDASKILARVISCCSRLEQYKVGEIQMSDELVFSLNASLEKMISYCHKLESKGDIYSSSLNSPIELISKIILVHKGYLVGLMMRRSSNLQKDILLVNLLKLFRTKLVDKNLKLKNLLYDILISIKTLVSEYVTKQYMKQQTGQQQQSGQMGSPLARTVSTPGIFTSIGSPDYLPGTGGSTIDSELSPRRGAFDTKRYQGLPSTWNDMLTIEPQNFSLRLRSLASNFKLEDYLGTKDDEYYLMDKESGLITKCYFKNFDLIEDASPYDTMNNSSLGLQLFDCVIERRNPQ